LGITWPGGELKSAPFSPGTPIFAYHYTITSISADVGSGAFVNPAETIEEELSLMIRLSYC
jgi:hypothetical protein